ncbi:hypothetical protein BaRGS_00012446, partial [Batillaria attramentaria]
CWIVRFARAEHSRDLSSPLLSRVPPPQPNTPSPLSRATQACKTLLSRAELNDWPSATRRCIVLDSSPIGWLVRCPTDRRPSRLSDDGHTSSNRT